MAKNRVFYSLMLLTLILIYIFTNTYYTLTLLVLTILLPAVSGVLMMISRRGISISLDLPQMMEKDSAAFTYHFENKSRLPAARAIFFVVMENQLTGTSVKRKVCASVGGRQTSSAELVITEPKVGTVTVSTEKIRIYDSLGLFSAKKKNLPERSSVIYPRMRELSAYMEKPIETGGDGSRYAADRTGFDVSEIFALREYVPGDEVRKIHWKLSSKMQKTMVRDFSLPLNYSVFLMTELSGGDEKLTDSRVELFSALSRALLENGINHNLAWYDGGEEQFHVREMDGFEDLEMAMAQLLASFCCDRPDAALAHYAASGYCGSRTTLIYVTSVPRSDKIAELALLQQVRVLYVCEGNETDGQELGYQMIPAGEIEKGTAELAV